MKKLFKKIWFPDTSIDKIRSFFNESQKEPPTSSNEYSFDFEPKEPPFYQNKKNCIKKKCAGYPQ